MTGKLDEVSQAIGRLQAEVEDLGDRLGASESLQESRHKENQSAIANLVRLVESKAVAVPSSAPAAPALTVRQRAGLIALAVTVLGVLGWLSEILIGTAASWLLHRWGG